MSLIARFWLKQDRSAWDIKIGWCIGMYRKFGWCKCDSWLVKWWLDRWFIFGGSAICVFCGINQNKYVILKSSLAPVMVLFASLVMLVKINMSS